jgi:hypothetical protein
LRARILARQGHQAGWGGAFAEGLRRHGWTADIATDWASCDLLVLWGVRRQNDIARQRAAGGEVCILERGYIGDRFQWTSVSFGGELNGRAEFRGARSDGRRFDRFHRHLLRPWRHRDGYALIVGQVPGDMSLRAVGGRLDGWYAATAEALNAAGLDARFRPHPMAARRLPVRSVPGAPTVAGSLEAALGGAAVVVTFNSNAAVDAALAGVPAVACDPGSMAWPVTSHSIGDALIRPNRGAWAARLAWCQWSMDEMRRGDCWAAVSEGAKMSRETAS